MNRVADDLLLQELERTEDYIHTCADAIDAKAGQIMAAAAFLAVQPAVLLIVPSIPRYAFAIQLLGFVCLLAAAVFAHFVLRIDDYPSPVVTEEWRDSIIANRAKHATEEDVAKTVLWGVVSFTEKRVEEGHATNSKKLRWLQWARGLTTLAFIVNFLIIFGVMVNRFF